MAEDSYHPFARCNRLVVAADGGQSHQRQDVRSAMNRAWSTHRCSQRAPPTFHAGKMTQTASMMTGNMPHDSYMPPLETDAISFARNHEWACEGCGHHWQLPTWMAIDAQERPDLLAELLTGAFDTATCPSCGGVVPRPLPILVLRFHDLLSVATVAHDGFGPDHLPALEGVIEEARARLGPALRDIPGPVMALRFSTMRYVGRRDLDTDLAAVESGRFLVGTGVDERRYRGLLGDILDARLEMQAARLIGRLWSAHTPQEVERLVEDVRQLNEEAKRAVSEAIQSEEDLALDGEHRDAVRGLSEFWSAIASGGSERAWAARTESVAEFWRRHVAEQLEALVEQMQSAQAKGDWTSAVRAGEEIMTIRRFEADPESEAALSYDLATAYLGGPGSPTGPACERAIVLLERVSSLVDDNPYVGTAGNRASTLMNLATAYSLRTSGDRPANLLRAERLFRESIRLFEAMDDERDAGRDWKDEPRANDLGARSA